MDQLAVFPKTRLVVLLPPGIKPGVSGAAITAEIVQAEADVFNEPKQREHALPAFATVSRARVSDANRKALAGLVLKIPGAEIFLPAFL